MKRFIVVMGMVLGFLVGAVGTASAVPGHTSCKGFGQANALEAHDGTLVEEVRAFAPGQVDDLVALVQVGGTFDGQVVPPFCQLK